MARKASVEKIVWVMFIIFNILAVITMFEFDSYVETMIWADVWFIGIFKAEMVFKTYLGLKTARPLNKKKKE